jgi:hypothetical protein
VAKNNPTRKLENQQLKASEVYEIVSSTLQEHFQLDMQAHEYEAQDVWDVLIAAAVERVSIEMASQLLEHAPTGNTVRAIVKTMLAQAEDL